METENTPDSQPKVKLQKNKNNRVTFYNMKSKQLYKHTSSFNQN